MKLTSNWKKLIQYEMELQGETFEDVVECTLTDEDLVVEFYSVTESVKENLLLFGLPIVFISQ